MKRGFASDELYDLPPEYCHYRDEGCELAQSCLDCPFPRCAHEEPGGVSQKRKSLRNAEVLRLRRQGMSPEELALSYGVSKRTIYRVLRRLQPDGDHNHCHDPAPAPGDHGPGEAEDIPGEPGVL